MNDPVTDTEPYGSTSPENSETGGDAGMESFEEKIQQAIAQAIQAGVVSEELPIVVGVDPTSGTIHVTNDEDAAGDDDGAAVPSFGHAEGGDDSEKLPEFKLPDSFFAHRDAISEPDKYLEQTSRHWGF